MRPEQVSARNGSTEAVMDRAWNRQLDDQVKAALRARAQCRGDALHHELAWLRATTPSAGR